MKQKTCFAFVLAALVLLAANASAQRGGRVSLGLDAGMLFPYMNHPEANQFNSEPDFVFGGHFDYGVSDHAGIQFGLLRSDQEVETSGKQTNTMTIQNLYTLFRWNFFLGRFQPYMLLGADYYLINLDPPLEDENDPGVTTGLGLDAILTDNISLGVSGRFSYIFTRDLDSARMVNCLATLTFSF